MKYNHNNDTDDDTHNDGNDNDNHDDANHDDDHDDSDVDGDVNNLDGAAAAGASITVLMLLQVLARAESAESLAASREEAVRKQAAAGMRGTVHGRSQVV